MVNKKTAKDAQTLGTAYELRSNTLVSEKPHVHAQGKEWRITSDLPLEAVLKCELLEQPLFGELNRYLLPHDACIFMSDCKTVKEYNKSLAAMKAKWMDQCMENDGAKQVYHITLSAQHLMEWGEEEDIPDEYEHMSEEEEEEEASDAEVVEPEDAVCFSDEYDEK